MVSRVERDKKKRKTKKVILFIGAVILTVSIGSGVKTAFADADVSTMLINWFNNKQSESIQEIDAAITTEKNLLMEDLRVELKKEMQRAEEELAKFTEAEKRERVKSLQEHAKYLIKNMNIDNKEQEKNISTKLDSIIKQAIDQMNNATATIPEKVVVPEPESPAKNESVEVPVTKPEPISEQVPSPVTSTPEPTPITDPIIEPVTESEIEEETEVVDEPTTESTPDPTSTPDIGVENVQANRDSSLEDELTE